jgi:hypothetical protein
VLLLRHFGFGVGRVQCVTLLPSGFFLLSQTLHALVTTVLDTRELLTLQRVARDLTLSLGTSVDAVIEKKMQSDKLSFKKPYSKAKQVQT